MSSLITLEQFKSGLSQVNTELANKVDTEEGMGLSSNDFTDTYMNKLIGLSNYTHPSVDTADTTSTATLTHGGTVTIVDSVTRDTEGHVTGINVKTATLPSDNNTDTLVTQTVTTTSGNYPILTTATAGQTATSTSTARFGTGVTVNPSTSTITATTFSGALSGNATTATSAATLTTARTIDGVSFNGSAAIVHYGTCDTAAATAAKTVTLSGFSLVTGASIKVKFTYANSASSPTLNINSTGAKAIVEYGTTAATTYMWQAGAVIEFTYDGTSWVMENGTLATTTYYGVTKLSSSTSSTSTTLAATPSAVKSAYDLATTANTAATTNASAISDLETALAGKVDAEDGMGLSSNDFTDTYLNKLIGLSNYTHPSVTASDTTSTTTLTHGGTVTIVDSVTRDTEGHVTGVNTKTATLPSDNNTDTLVTQTVTTTSAAYPILTTSTASQTATSTSTVRFASAVTLNPGTGTITATTFSGALSGNATTATSATSATNSTNVYSTLATTTAGTYYLDFHSTASSANKALKHTANLSLVTVAGTTSAVGTETMIMGNSTASGTAANATAILRMYGTGAYYGQISAQQALTANRTYYLNNAGGTLVTHATWGTAVGGTAKPVYISSTGAATAISATVGSSTTPVYLSSGTITACDITVASDDDVTAMLTEVFG